MGQPNGYTIGTIYSFPSSIHSFGARTARKLREYGFIAGEYDHLYINFSSCVEENTIHYSNNRVDPRIQYVEFGLSPSKLISLSDSEKESIVSSATFAVLNFIANNNSSKLEIIKRVLADILLKGTELEITHISKETLAYSITISYSIRPIEKGSSAYVTYLDKRKGKLFKKEFLKLRHYEDIYSVVGSINVLKDSILMKPRASFKASLNTEGYSVPINILISEIPEFHTIV